MTIARTLCDGTSLWLAEAREKSKQAMKIKREEMALRILANIPYDRLTPKRAALVSIERADALLKALETKEEG